MTQVTITKPIPAVDVTVHNILTPEETTKLLDGLKKIEGFEFTIRAQSKIS